MRSAYDFSRIPVHSYTPEGIQPKLMVNTPGDIYEQEADRVFEQVMRIPEPPLQRACACGGKCAIVGASIRTRSTSALIVRKHLPGRAAGVRSVIVLCGVVNDVKSAVIDLPESG
jgi:hypothetical protein